MTPLALNAPYLGLIPLYVGLAAALFAMIMFQRAQRRTKKLEEDKKFVERQKNEILHIIAKHEVEHSKKPSDDKPK